MTLCLLSINSMNISLENKVGGKNMKTKLNSKILISALLSFSMMIMLLSGVKAATENETLTSSNWEYVVNGENVYIMKYTGTEEDVVVPAVIDGKKVVSIGEDTFTDCKTLNNITLSENIKNIESNSREAFPCFNGCDNLENIIVDENNSEFSSEDGVLYSKNKEVILLYPRGKNVAEFVIPEHVKYLGRKVFSKCENLKRVSIANGIKDLSERVFEGCSSLESVNIPESLESIGVGAFSGCESLKNIVIPNGTKSIGIYAFSNCKSLKEIAIPSAVESLVETNDGNMVEGGDEYAVLHLVCGDGVDDALLQTLVEYLVVLQLHIEQHIGLVAEIEQLIKRPDVLSCEFGGLPGADVQLEHLLVGVVLDEADAVRGALYRCIMENNELAVLRDMNVALKAVCTGLLDRLVECKRAVLRVFARETAVREQHDLFHISFGTTAH